MDDQQTIIDLDLVQMIEICAILVVPIVITISFQLNLWKRILWSSLRMGVQLVLVGFYLKFIFHLNSILINCLWVLIVVMVAVGSILSQARLRFSTFVWPTFAGTLAASVAVTCLFVIGILQPDPFYDARYLIPIFGMVLGNCMRGNIIALDTCYGRLRARRREYQSDLLLGASRFEAVRPFVQDALRASIAPMIATMATMGIVSLPGMMTGQILGGTSPLIAIKYQIAIMVCIFTVMTLGAMLNLLLTQRVAFDEFDRLRDNVFAA